MCEEENNEDIKQTVKGDSRAIFSFTGSNEMDAGQYWRYILQYLWKANLALTGLYHVSEFLRHLMTIV